PAPGGVRRRGRSATVADLVGRTARRAARHDPAERRTAHLRRRFGAVPRHAASGRAAVDHVAHRGTGQPHRRWYDRYVPYRDPAGRRYSAVDSGRADVGRYLRRLLAGLIGDTDDG